MWSQQSGLQQATWTVSTEPARWGGMQWEGCGEEGGQQGEFLGFEG